MDDFEVNTNYEKRNRSLKYLVIALLVAISVLGCVLIFFAVASYTNAKQPEKELNSALLTSPSFEVTENTSLADLYENVSASVVTIFGKSGSSQFPFGSSSDNIGSGFIVTEAGHIVTNYHVISGISKITVELNNGNKYSANVINYNSSLDIAVIKINPNETLSVAYIGDATSARTGDWVFAIGTPYSEELYGTITRGIISYSGRTLAGSKAKYIQIDAAINPGNSGGPLFNLAGEVIGINTSKITQTTIDNIGFAISSQTFKPIVEQILGTPATIKLGIGIGGIAVSDTNYADTLCDGVIVMSVTTDGPADLAGIQMYDIIVKIDGTDIKNVDEIKDVINKHNEGDTVDIVVLRDSTDNEVTLSLTIRNLEFYE